MNSLRFPSTDSAAWRGLITAIEALITFDIGFVGAIWAVPGVPQAVVKYVEVNGPQLFTDFGIPMILGTGLTSYIINRIRPSVKNY